MNEGWKGSRRLREREVGPWYSTRPLRLNLRASLAIIISAAPFPFPRCLITTLPIPSAGALGKTLPSDVPILLDPGAGTVDSGGGAAMAVADVLGARTSGATTLNGSGAEILKFITELFAVVGAGA